MIAFVSSTVASKIPTPEKSVLLIYTEVQVLKELEGLRQWASEIRTLDPCRTGTDSRGKKSPTRAPSPKLSLYTAGTESSNLSEPILLRFRED